MTLITSVGATGLSEKPHILRYPATEAELKF